MPADYLSGNKTPHRYRNPFLVNAMAELGMIDTMGYGIYQMHVGQAQRYFPMPDYDLSDAKMTRLTLYGGVIDPAYSEALIQDTHLPLGDILALDRVQKRLPLDADMAKHLKKAGLIEGRKPNWHVSAAVAKATASKADYIRMRGMDDAHYKQQILDLITQFGSASRQDIDKLLFDKLSDALDDQQKDTKIGHLLTSLRRAGKIRNSGPRKTPVWVLAE